MDRRDINYYEARAQTINLGQITSIKRNAEILQLLRDNDPNFTYFSIHNIFEDENDFVVREGDDLGWLGYFAGQNKSLRTLYIDYLPQDREQVDAFIRAVKDNRSIQTLDISHDIGGGFQNLGSLLKNDNLKYISFRYFHIGLECARNIALMLTQRNQRNAIKTIEFEESYFSDGAVVEIARALSAHPQLEELIFGEHSIGRNSCVALGNTLESWRDPNLKKLSLANNSFDDEGLHSLVAGMKNCRNLTHLALEGNEPITSDGCRSLSTLFQSEHCRLKHLYLDFMRIDDEGMRLMAAGLGSLSLLETLSLIYNSVGDEGLQSLLEGISNCCNLKLRLSGNRLISAVGLRSLSALLQSDRCSLTSLHLRDIDFFSDDMAAALADGLRCNNKLKSLIFSPGQLTSAGWSAFSKLLCDTSTINNTYLSNHTIETIGDWCNRGTPDDVKQLLALNQIAKKPVAMLKILEGHPDFDVEPLCQWKLKLLPLVMSWFERVDALVYDHKIIILESEVAIQSRKLSTLYKFIRGMPLLAVDGYCSHNKAAMLDPSPSPSSSRKRRIDQLREL